MTFKYDNVIPTTIKFNNQSLNILRYSKEPLIEAKRGSLNTYSLSSMNSYIGLLNDSWGNIVNINELQNHIGEYIFLEFIISDTGKIGRIILKLLATSDSTIYTDNIEWGYIESHSWEWSMGAIPVWGKPYLLSINNDDNTSITVTRITSPNQHASIGVLTNGSEIYYGDILKISASANSGYKLSTFTVNGVSWSNENEMTVIDNINIVTMGAISASWHTVYTGSIKYSFTSSPQTTNISVPISLKIGAPTRITATASGNSSFAHISGSTAIYGNVPVYGYIYGDLDDMQMTFGVSGYGSNYITCSLDGDYSFDDFGAASITITEIDQYY